MRLLIAYDGSECANAGIEDLRRSGLSGGEHEVLVLTVAARWIPPDDAFSGPTVAEEVVHTA